jgi:hypothetical protein
VAKRPSAIAQPPPRRVQATTEGEAWTFATLILTTRNPGEAFGPGFHCETKENLDRERQSKINLKYRCPKAAAYLPRIRNN